MGNTPVERYLDHLDDIFQREPRFFKNESKQPGLPGVTAILYPGVPEKGYITGLTYGLSLGQHPDWKFGRPELCISIASTEEIWGEVAAFLANQLRGIHPFAYGDTIDFGTPIHESSDMSAFFVFAPSILEKPDYLDIEIGTPYKINIAGLYPIYKEEIATIQKIGLKDFWFHPDFDMYDIHRPPIIR